MQLFNTLAYSPIILAAGDKPKTPEGSPDLSPIVELMNSWGSYVLWVIAAVCAVIAAVLIIISAVKAMKAENPEEKQAAWKGIIWKVIWFLLSISGMVVLGVLEKVAGVA